MQTREERLARRREYYKLNKDKWAKYAKEHRKQINEYWRKKRAEDPDKYREKRNRWRAENVDKCREYQNKYYASDKGKENYKKYYSEHKSEFIERAKKSNARHPNERYAQGVLNHALKMGKIKRMPCEICGSMKSQAHHSDYNKPLDVMWLCRKHHAEWHMNNKPVRASEEVWTAELEERRKR